MMMRFLLFLLLMKETMMKMVREILKIKVLKTLLNLVFEKRHRFSRISNTHNNNREQQSHTHGTMNIHHFVLC